MKTHTEPTTLLRCLHLFAPIFLPFPKPRRTLQKPLKFHFLTLSNTFFRNVKTEIKAPLCPTRPTSPTSPTPIRSTHPTQSNLVKPSPTKSNHTPSPGKEIGKETVNFLAIFDHSL
jgi:hypothetical protein